MLRQQYVGRLSTSGCNALPQGPRHEPLWQYVAVVDVSICGCNAEYRYYHKGTSTAAASPQLYLLDLLGTYETQAAIRAMPLHCHTCRHGATALPYVNSTARPSTPSGPQGPASGRDRLTVPAGAGACSTENESRRPLPCTVCRSGTSSAALRLGLPASQEVLGALELAMGDPRRSDVGATRR